MILKEGGERAFSLLAARMGFQRGDESRQPYQDGETLTVNWVVDGDLRVTVTNDQISESTYLQVFGGDRESVADTAAALADLGTFSYEELLHTYRTAEDAENRASSLVRLGLGAPPARDEEFSSAIAEGLQSPQKELRNAGLWAASYYALPEFAPLIEKIASAEDDDDIRETAELMLSIYRERGQK
ncbi:hypothetical protein [Streptomyces luteolus]|uniref:HEAT repeat domain-containing protein n=1 Tax=Streptomyces luteolus TaxID=3043615 RepID=A0ABT6T042_9ACTN|nr:hypothetical protein [Streptomyces sp. B-S-A12]MDI3421233.1 hypothetical protein [Streptomyces sp. B-S-A12]